MYTTDKDNIDKGMIQGNILTEHIVKIHSCK